MGAWCALIYSTMGGKRVILKFGSGILTRTDRAEMDQVQLARLVAIDDLRLEPVRREGFGEVARDAAPRHVDLDRLGHGDLPYPC